MQHDVRRTPRTADIDDIAVGVRAQPLEIALVVAVELEDVRASIPEFASGCPRSLPWSATSVSPFPFDCACPWFPRQARNVPAAVEESKTNPVLHRIGYALRRLRALPLAALHLADAADFHPFEYRDLRLAPRL